MPLETENEPLAELIVPAAAWAEKSDTAPLPTR
jgi:hypothetical protein